MRRCAKGDANGGGWGSKGRAPSCLATDAHRPTPAVTMPRCQEKKKYSCIGRHRRGRRRHRRRGRRARRHRRLRRGVVGRPVAATVSATFHGWRRG